MPKFAILNNNVVENLIVCDTLEEAQAIGNAVQYNFAETPVYNGSTYDPETQTFSNPISGDTNA
jgi:hypothetical protein